MVVMVERVTLVPTRVGCFERIRSQACPSVGISPCALEYSTKIVESFSEKPLIANASKKPFLARAIVGSSMKSRKPITGTSFSGAFPLHEAKSSKARQKIVDLFHIFILINSPKLRKLME